MHSRNVQEERRTVRLLTLTLDNVHFGLDIHAVREILDMTDITGIPHTPDYMRGVVNVRGSAVPVVDLRLKFGLPEAERTLNTRIVILEVPRKGGMAAFGAIADSVKEVLEVEAGDIDPPPHMRAGTKADFITGICYRNERFLLILDVARIFAEDKALSLETLDLNPASAAFGLSGETAAFPEG
ncbi:chemotaxis protein CheW [Megalodesulfovibrio paquesii]